MTSRHPRCDLRPAAGRAVPVMAAASTLAVVMARYLSSINLPPPA